MHERLLVPLDGTPVAEQALTAATSIARASGAHIHLATVLIPPVMELPELPYQASLGDVEAEYLEATATRVRAAGVDGVSTKILEAYDITGALEEHRSRVGATLTVMASHGRGAFERAWLGSVADRFVRTSEAPVLLVRATPGETETPDLTTDVRFERVLVPLDGSELSAGALGPAAALSGPLGTTYVLLHVIEPPYAPGAALQPAGFGLAEEQVQALRREAEDQLEAAAQSLRAKGYTVDTVAELSWPVASGILRQAEKSQADLVSITTRGRGGIGRVMLGSVADKVIRGAECPVLITRPPNR